VHRADAPQSIDERAYLPAHLLPTGQKQALIDQLARRARQEKSPAAGLLMDIDHYSVRPTKIELGRFLDLATTESVQLMNTFLKGKR
jgi:hypothetical protein